MGGHGAAPITRAQLERYAGLFQAPAPAELELYDEPAVDVTDACDVGPR